MVVLTGARGVGKTQLAAAYARARLAGGWRLIAWINAQDRESLLAGLAAVTEATTLSDGGTRQSAADAAQALRHWLEADGSRCLLVLEDGQDLGLLRPFMPAVGAARVLIIGAREPVAEWGTSVPVDVFSAEEAVALLDGRTGLADEAGASAVAAELGHLPLALDQAAAVIAGQHLGYEAYLAKLRALRVEDDLVRDENGEEQPYPPGAAEVVLLSLEAARAADPVGVAAGVMEIMAMLSPAAVRCDLLRAAGQAGTLLGGGRRVAASMVDRVLEQLNERSLLGFSLDGQAVSVYCLVARVVHRELARRGRLVTACRAAASSLEMSAEALVKPGDHAAVGEMLGQITALLGNAATLADDPGEPLATMLIRLRSLALHYLIELGDRLPQAIAVGKALTADLERTAGSGLPRHPERTGQPGRRLPDRRPDRRRDPAVRADPGRPGADAWPGTSRHPDLAEQSRGRLPGGWPGQRGDPAVPADLGRPGAAAGRDHPGPRCRKLRGRLRPRAGREAIALSRDLAGERLLGRIIPTPAFADQPGRGLPGRRPGRRRDPACPADSRHPGATAGCRPSQHAGRTEQPRQHLPGGGPACRGDPLVRAERGRVRAAARS